MHKIFSSSCSSSMNSYHNMADQLCTSHDIWYTCSVEFPLTIPVIQWMVTGKSWVWFCRKLFEINQNFSCRKTIQRESEPSKTTKHMQQGQSHYLVFVLKKGTTEGATKTDWENLVQNSRKTGAGGKTKTANACLPCWQFSPTCTHHHTYLQKW